MKKLKLLVIELNYHFEVLYNFCSILEKMDQVETTILTTKKVLNDEKLSEEFPRLKWQVLKKFPKNISQVEPAIAHADIIFFNTIEYELSLFEKFDFGDKPVISRVHNANTFFLSKINYQWIPTLFQIWKDMSHFLRKTVLEKEEKKRKRMLKKVDFFCFPDEAIKQYALDNHMLKPEKTLKTLPLVTCQKRNSKAPEDHVVVTITGGIDPRRKNYTIVEQLLKNVKLNTTVEIHFLGRLKGKKATSIAQRLNEASRANERVKLYFYEHFIEQKEFDQVMDRTSFLLLPINITTRFHLQQEIYGKTKISGSINDAIKYGKPAILPFEYQINNRLSPLFDQYTDEESLKNLFTDWVNNKTFINKTAQVDTVLQQYTLEAIAANFQDQLRTLSN